MPTVIAMLRGVNVGGHNKIRMEDLRALHAGLGFRDARTHIQSGNVIFTAAETDLDTVAQRIEKAIEKKFAIKADVILRTAAEMRDVIARNPFAGRRGIEPNKLLVTFFAHDPGREAHENIRKLESAPDEFVLDGRELYSYYPNGFSGARLPASAIDRALLRARGTARNWNTVLKLVELATQHKL